MSQENTTEPGKRRGGRSRILTREAIAQAAFDLVDAEGPEALTIARLSEELGVGQMTLYGYVDSKTAIIQMLPDVLMADLPQLSRDDSWELVMEACFLTLYGRFTEHSSVTELIARAPVFSRAQADLLEDVLDVLVAAGFSTADALSLHRTLATYTVGYALFDIAESSGESPRRTWIDELPAADYPHIAEATPLLKDAVDADHFRHGLLGIIGGFSPRAR